jgi:XTP/dITP diphosphohydrolase
LAEPLRLVVATGNPGKLREFEELLRPAGVRVEGLDTDVPEDAPTYAGNALLKAEAACATAGRPAVGDDSGLEVAALGGEPGLHSARVAATQEERHRLLFERLAGVPRPWRARFVCVVALVAPGRPARFFEGERWGEIVAPRDGPSGFGYDPVFLVPERGMTFAEMPEPEKHRWSHRGAAITALLSSGALAELSART